MTAWTTATSHLCIQREFKRQKVICVEFLFRKCYRPTNWKGVLSNFKRTGAQLSQNISHWVFQHHSPNAVLEILKSSSRLHEVMEVACIAEHTVLRMGKHYQHWFAAKTTLASPTTVSSGVLSTLNTDKCILVFLAIKIYRHTKHYVSHLMECQNF